MSPEVIKFIEDNIELIENGNFQEMHNVARRELSCAHVLELQGSLCSAGICCNANGVTPNFLKRRIRQIKCYNVGFGDCFLCKNDDAKMVVDCGKYKSVPPEDVISDIVCELETATTKKYLMLSHLHEDHYSGIEKIFEKATFLKFQELYLPNYITNGSLELYAAMIFLCANSEFEKIAREVLQIPKISMKNLESHAKIHFLSEGAVVFNHLCCFKTLLPKRSKKRLWTDDIAPIREFCDKYKEILGYVENEYGSVTVTIEEETDVGEQIAKLLNEVKSIDVPKVDEKKIKELKKRFQAHHNSLSLAFHELLVENTKNVLFLGDAEKKDLEYLSDNGRLRNQYYFVKIQHHGTKSHFYRDLPYAKYYAISNGKNGEKCKISPLYGFTYADKTACVCSNNNCQLKENGVSCESKHNDTICGMTNIFQPINIP